ncbi:MAG: hypothetical protein II891_06895 [Bacteroidales bacterium]|nr:hypothetical protein [Bacteroidales bacterium]
MAVSDRYLLRTDAQAAAFRRRFREDALAVAMRSMEAWFQRLPLFEWVPFRPEPSREEIVTGLLCLLYIDGRINLTFSSDMRFLQRGALSPEEYHKWVQSK